MSTETARFDPSRATAILVAGDVVLIALFVLAGEIRHGFGPTEYPLRVLGTLLQFLIGWFAVAFLAGVYTREVRLDVRTAALRTAAAWVLAALVGQALRATDLFHGNAAPAFVAVTVAVGLVLLVPWRVAVARFQLLD